MTREFVRLSELALPLLEDFQQLNRCTYNAQGVSFINRAEDLMRDPAAPYQTGALVFDRRNATGNYYQAAGSGDTLTTSFFNLQGRSNVWLTFSYQRGLRTDSTQAGIRSRLLVGPEVRLTASNPPLLEGDSLVVEALQSSGATWNPAASSWVRIGTINGGIDTETKKFRVQIPQANLHNHSRFRIRLIAANNAATVGLPFDDADPFIVDALQIAAPTGSGTDLEPLGIELGAKYYTHIPRDVKFITPKVKIASNGLQVTLAVYQVKLVLQDQLGREVYNRRQSLVSPAPHTDVVLDMPSFAIEGSQGGVFAARVTIEQMFSDYYRANDTNTFYRSLLIDDVYAYDDGAPDTAGSMTAAHNSWFFYTFKPIRTDSLRGMEFFHLTANGSTNWVFTFRDPNGNTRYTRSLSYDVLERGFQRGLFSAAVPLSADSTYIIQCNMTQGFGLGGDASRGLVIQDHFSFTSPHYWLLHPNVLADFSDNASGAYGSVTSPKNASGGGPLLPMMRLVYRGSSTFLPVELLSFRGRRSGERVLLDFATASESETFNFRIDRSSSTGSWEHVATIPAKNNLHGAGYSAVDDRASVDEALYRLTSYDLDGSEQVLGTITVESRRSPQYAFRVIPNPASDVARLILPAIGSNMHGVLYDEAGRIAKTFVIDGASPTVDLDGLPQGMYVLEVKVDAETYRTKLSVRH
jgi:hypothetical protein